MKIAHEASAPSSFKIGDWIVDIDRGGVFEGENFTRLEPRPMEVLLYLARAGGAVVSASELKEHIWNETYVVDDVVKRCISQIRAAFGDDARQQKVISTTPKRGYSIVEKVDWQLNAHIPVSSTHPTQKHLWTALVVASCVVVLGAYFSISQLFLSDELSEVLPVDQLEAEYAQAKTYYDSYEFEDNESAIAIYKRIIVARPGEALAYAGLANALLQKVIRWSGPDALMADAKGAAVTALELAPETPQALKALGLYHQEREQFAEAIDAYGKAVELDPGYWAAANNIGEVYREIEDLVEAKNWFECALQISSSREQSLSALGEIHFRLGEYELSRNYFNDALVIAPYAQDALIGLSFLSLYNREPQSAIGFCSRLDEVWPNMLDCQLNSGVAAMMMGDLEQAKNIFQRLSQDKSRYWRVIGDIRLRQISVADPTKVGALQSAEQLLMEIDENFSDGLFTKKQSYWLKALVAATERDNEAAINYLSEAVVVGHTEFHWDMIEPGFSSLRNNIRFINLVRHDAPRKNQNSNAGERIDAKLEHRRPPMPKTCVSAKTATH